MSEPAQPTPKLTPLGIGLGVAAVIAIIAAATVSGDRSNRMRVAPVMAVPEASLTAPVAPTAAEDRWIEWKATDGPLHLDAVGYSLDVTPAWIDGLAAAKLVAADPNGRRIEWTGMGSSWEASADVALVRLTPEDTAPVILASSFSGGAHCCTSLTLLKLEPYGWRRHDLGQWDGGTPALPQDLDGDGRREFTSVDQSFLYAFESYAGSLAPPVIQRFEGGRLRDVSSERAFRPVFARAADQAREACRQRSNGACAAYVASAARTGALDDAWTLMLASYDQASEWNLPTACRVRTASDCPADALLTFATFPEALQWFLGDKGYTPRPYLEPLNAAGPSYNCGSVSSDGEVAVCGDPGLAVLDRTLAVAFTRAMALTETRTSLRASQRQFIDQRNAVADSTTLRSTYEARIEQLLAIDE